MVFYKCDICGKEMEPIVVDYPCDPWCKTYCLKCYGDILKKEREERKKK